jgi:hypothetical protein
LDMNSMIANGDAARAIAYFDTHNDVSSLQATVKLSADTAVPMHAAWVREEVRKLKCLVMAAKTRLKRERRTGKKKIESDPIWAAIDVAIRASAQLAASAGSHDESVVAITEDSDSASDSSDSLESQTNEPQLRPYPKQPVEMTYPEKDARTLKKSLTISSDEHELMPDSCPTSDIPQTTSSAVATWTSAAPVRVGDQGAAKARNKLAKIAMKGSGKAKKSHKKNVPDQAVGSKAMKSHKKKVPNNAVGSEALNKIFEPPHDLPAECGSKPTPRSRSWTAVSPTGKGHPIEINLRQRYFWIKALDKGVRCLSWLKHGGPVGAWDVAKQRAGW